MIVRFIHIFIEMYILLYNAFHLLSTKIVLPTIDPPSTGKRMPVRNDATLLSAKKEMAALVSDTSPIRPNGYVFLISLNNASTIFGVIPDVSKSGVRITA